MRANGVLCGVLAAGVLIAPACAATRPIRALRGPGSCLSLERRKGCDPARGFTNPNGPRSAAVSADGRSLYIDSDNANAIGILRIDPRTGRLSQEDGAAGCLFEHETGPEVGGCARVRGFAGQTSGIAISPDDRFVYVSSTSNDAAATATGAVAVFARDAEGRLQQLAGADGCMASRALDGCTVVPALDGYDITLDPAGAHAYVGGHTFTVFGRDAATGVLAYAGCENADGNGCARTPYGLAVKAPTWVGGVGYASAFGPAAEARGDEVFPLLALRINAFGLPELVPGVGGCRVDITYLRGCPYDGRLSGYLTGLVPVAPGEIVGFSSAEGEVPAPRGTPFQLWSLRLDVSGAMSAKGAHCLSTTRHRRCGRGDRLLGGAAVVGNARRIYIAGERGVTVVARGRAGALRVLDRIGTLRDPLDYSPTAAAITPDGRFVYVIAQTFYGTGSVKAYATTG